MPRKNLTANFVEKHEEPAGARVDYFDTNVPGLALRISGKTGKSEGSKSYAVFYRYRGKLVRDTIGSVEKFKLGEARDKARELQRIAAAGEDPRERKAALAPEREPDTIERVVDDFMQRYMEGKKRAPRYIAETRRNFDNHVLPRWRGRDIKSITRRDVVELLDAIAEEGSDVVGKNGKKRHVDGGPIAANRTLAAVRKLFNWSIQRSIIDATPVALVEAPGEETERERALRDEEIATLWKALDGTAYPFGPYVKTALLTMQRRSEVAGMRWEEIDETQKLWVIPSERTKSGRTHVVPLSTLALEIILATMPKPGKETKQTRLRRTGPVFTTRADAPISGFSKFKAELSTKIAEICKGDDSLAEMQPWTIHDLRRTGATKLGELGFSQFIIGRILNHAEAGVTKIYDRFEYLEEKRRGLEALSSKIESIIGSDAKQDAGQAAQ